MDSLGEFDGSEAVTLRRMSGESIEDEVVHVVISNPRRDGEEGDEGDGFEGRKTGRSWVISFGNDPLEPAESRVKIVRLDEASDDGGEGGGVNGGEREKTWNRKGELGRIGEALDDLDGSKRVSALEVGVDEGVPNDDSIRVDVSARAKRREEKQGQVE